jgi:hypothetical protein
MNDQHQEISELRKENQRLRAMLARAGVTVLPNVDLPTPAELDRIFTRVLAAYPVLNYPETNKEEVYNAMHFLCFVFRTDKVNTDRSTGYFTDHCRDWLRQQGLHPASMGLRSFCVAAIASGISFSGDYPYLSFGISMGSASKPSNKWRETLEHVPRPLPNSNYLDRPQQQQTSIRETVKL